MSVELLALMDGGSASTTFTDSSGNGVSLSRVGAVQSTGRVKYGLSSGYAAQAIDYRVTGTVGTPPGTGDFTAETWVQIVSGGIPFRSIFGLGDEAAAGHHYFVYLDATSGRLTVNSSTDGLNGSVIIQEGSALSIDIWHHIALEVISGTAYLLRDGIVIGSSGSTVNISSGAVSLFGTAQGFYSLHGYLDEFRYTVGENVYGGSSYTVPGSFRVKVISSSIDSLLQQTRSASAQFGAILKGESAETVSVDSFLNKVFTSGTGLNAILAKIAGSSVSVDGQLQKLLSAATSTDALLSSSAESAASLDAQLQALASASTATDALLVVPATSATSVDGQLQSLAIESVAADALLELVRTGVVSSDALLAGTKSTSTLLGALIQLIRTEHISADALLSGTLSKITSADALISKLFSLAASTDALLSATNSAYISFDANIQGKLSVTGSFNALLESRFEDLEHTICLVNTNTLGVTKFSGDSWESNRAIGCFKGKRLLISTSGLYEIAGADSVTGTIRTGKIFLEDGALFSIYRVDALLKADNPVSVTVYSEFDGVESSHGPFMQDPEGRAEFRKWKFKTARGHRGTSYSIEISCAGQWECRGIELYPVIYPKRLN